MITIKLIPLTHVTGNECKEILFNINTIVYMFTNMNNLTTIVYSSNGDQDYVFVKETPEQIRQLIWKSD